MMKKKDDKQAVLKQWFDNTYKRKGYRYLRPLKAYGVFLSILEAKRGEKILDIACGGGLMLKNAVDQGMKAYGIDISEEAIRMCRTLVPEALVQTGNAEALPYSGQQFDCITCLGSLERFFDREKALSEMKRVAGNDARFCIMVRNAGTFEWSMIRRPLGIINRKAHMAAKFLDDWKQLFTSNGFEIIRIYPDQWPIQKMRGLLFWKKNHARAIYSSLLPLRYSNEFIFLLKKGK